MLDMFNSFRQTFNSAASYIPGYSYLPSVFGSADSSEESFEQSGVVANPQAIVKLPLAAELVNIRKLMAFVLDDDAKAVDLELEADEAQLLKDLTEVLNIKMAEYSMPPVFDAKAFLLQMCCKAKVTQEELQRFESFIMKDQEMKRFFNEKIKALQALYRKLKAAKAFDAYGEDMAIDMPDDGLKIDKQVYLQLLNQAFEAINQQLVDGDSEFVVRYDEEASVYTISKGNVNVEVTIDNGFSAHADALGPEANAALVVAAKQYVAARRQADPSKPVPPFTLTCADEVEAKDILLLLDKEGIPCTKVVLTDSNQTLGQKEIEALKKPQREEVLDDEQDSDLEDGAVRKNKQRSRF